MIDMVIAHPRVRTVQMDVDPQIAAVLQSPCAPLRALALIVLMREAEQGGGVNSGE